MDSTSTRRMKSKEKYHSTDEPSYTGNQPKSCDNGAAPTISSRHRSITLTLTFPRWLYCYGSIIVVVVACVSSLCIRYKGEKYMNEKIQTVGIEILDIFANFDKDGDLYLSLEEAEPLMLQFVDISKNKDTTFNLDVTPGEKAVKIYAHFRPLNISTMTKDFEHDLSGNRSFTGLFNWQAASIPEKEFAVSRFQSLLPNPSVEAAPGMIYDIVASPKGMFGSSNLPSDRFYPPRVLGVEFFLHRLLSMFHPRPFIIMRFPPQGVKGCVTAVNQDWIAVVIRMHIEFQLNESPDLPFWFTPAQLTGTLIMAKDGSEIKHFHLHVPHERRLNVDMEWLTDDANNNQENMEVDIGYMPLMELTSQGLMDGTDKKVEEENEHPDINWDSEISTTEANARLEESFFPFKKLKYYNISEVFDIAEEESKLVHSILLWGALDDQSC